MKYRIITSVMAASVAVAVTGCASQPSGTSWNGTFTHISTAKAYNEGYMGANMTIAEVKQRGDLGLGMMANGNGEFMMLDGMAYKSNLKGEAINAEDSEAVTYAAVVKFEHDDSFVINSSASINELKSQLEDRTRYSSEYFHAVRIDGLFSKMRTRATASSGDVKNNAPEPTIYEYKDIRATVFGVRCPEYAAKICFPGWHFHFVSKNANFGGHVIELSMSEAAAYSQHFGKLDVVLPRNLIVRDTRKPVAKDGGVRDAASVSQLGGGKYDVTSKDDASGSKYESRANDPIQSKRTISDEDLIIHITDDKVISRTDADDVAEQVATKMQADKTDSKKAKEAAWSVGPSSGVISGPSSKKDAAVDEADIAADEAESDAQKTMDVIGDAIAPGDAVISK